MDFDSAWEDWPNVPETQKDKRLPHVGEIDESGAAVLSSKGWNPIDVRIMPSANDHDKAEQVKAWLEGVRLGVIEPDPKILKFVELEARTYGLLNSKGPSEKKPKKSLKDKKALEDILGIGIGEPKEVLGLHERGSGGRPKGSTTVKRRPKKEE